MINTAHYKELLEQEKSRILKELETIAVPSNKEKVGEWDAKSSLQEEEGIADPNEVANKLEDFETNTSLVSHLQSQLQDIHDALQRIEAGTYGTCEVSGEVIEEDRLGANPSARTCKAHMNTF